MAAKAVTFDDIKQQIATNKLAPVYLLHGQESYFLDLLAKEFEKVTPDGDKEFNQYILFAPQIEPGSIMDLCYRCPMMSDRQVVILKEAQAVNAVQINKLASYVLHPSSTTVLVIIFRGDDAKGKDLLAACKTNAVTFYSPQIKDYEMPKFISGYIQQKGLTADPKAVSMLNDFIGANLSAATNQIDKLASILGNNARITPEAVELNIGISKEYNSFELTSALSRKDASKIMKIVDYFAANPKGNPLPQIVATLFNYFSNLLIVHYSADKSDAGIANTLGFKKAYASKDYVSGIRYYNARQVIEVIWALRQFDSQSKGNGSRQDGYDLLKELMFHILTAQGNLGI